MASNCAACGDKLVYRGRGRPRKYCEACVPSGSGGAAWREAWEREHAEELEAKRLKEHADWMAEWRANMRQRKKTIAENRRRLEAKKRKDGSLMMWNSLALDPDEGT